MICCMLGHAVLAGQHGWCVTTCRHNSRSPRKPGDGLLQPVVAAVMPWALPGGGQFRDEQGGVHAVLVPDIGAGQDSRRLSSKPKRNGVARRWSWNCWICFGDVLEAREGLDHLARRRPRQMRAGQGGGNDGASPPRRWWAGVPCGLVGRRGCSAAARSRSGCRVSSRNLPSLSRTATPRRSQSGSVPKHHVRAHLVGQLHAPG